MKIQKLKKTVFTTAALLALTAILSACGQESKDRELQTEESRTAAGEQTQMQEELTEEKETQDNQPEEIAYNVVLNVDGEKKPVVTTAATVEELIEEQGITLGEEDRIKPKLGKNLKEGMKIVIKRVETKEETVTEKVPYESKKEYSDKMDSGDKKVTTKGVDGEKEVVYKVTYVDGEEESREAVSEKEIKSPVDEVVTYGTKKSSGSSGSKSDGVLSVGDTKDGKKVISRQQVDDCDGSGHGYYVITFDDGSEEYIDY